MLLLEPGMSQIEFLTYPVLFKWTERDSKKILFDDGTGSVVKEIYHSISFIPLISLNLIFTDEISIKLIQKLRPNTRDLAKFRQNASFDGFYEQLNSHEW